MTEIQKQHFIDIMSNGCSMGLAHPFECMVNHERMLDAVATSETELRELTGAVNQAFLAFWKTTDPDLGSMTPDQFTDVVNAWFENREKQKRRWLEHEIEERTKTLK